MSSDDKTLSERLREHADREPLPEAGARAGVRSGETQVEQARREQDAQQAGQPDDSLAQEVGADEVQHKMDEATKQGYFGQVPDDTPNEHYTLPGVTRGLPTPEAPKPPVKQ